MSDYQDRDLINNDEQGVVPCVMNDNEQASTSSVTKAEAPRSGRTRTTSNYGAQTDIATVVKLGGRRKGGSSSSECTATEAGSSEFNFPENFDKKSKSSDKTSSNHRKSAQPSSSVEPVIGRARRRAATVACSYKEKPLGTKMR